MMSADRPAASGMRVAAAGLAPPAWLAAAAIVALAGGLRIASLGVDGLWLDEVFGATYDNLGFVDVVLAVLRFDIHPPLYYLQLKLWSLPSNGDTWLMLNSVCWSLGTVAIAGHAVRSLAGSAAAGVTMLMLAVSASEVFFASELRMYAMISCLAVLGWSCAERWARQPDARRALALVAVIGALAATHSAAFIAVFCVLAYALWARVSAAGTAGAALRAWALPAACAALLLAPWLLNASMRSVSHTTRPDLDIVARTLSGWLLGYGAVELPPALRLATAGLLVVLVAAGCLFAGATVRRLLVCFVVGPVLLVAGVSLFLRPIWLDRTVAFCAPLLAVAVGLCFARGPGRRWAALLVAVAVALAVLDGVQAVQPRKMQFRELARDLATLNAERLPVHVPVNLTFWGVARYAQGPAWGSLFDVQDPVAADDSKTWSRIYQRIGEPRLRRWGLWPSTRTLDTPAGTLWIGASALPTEVAGRPHWLIGDAGLAGRPAPCGAAAVESVRRYRGLTLLRCAATGLRP